jgi:hypothetical protein
MSKYEVVELVLWPTIAISAITTGWIIPFNGNIPMLLLIISVILFSRLVPFQAGMDPRSYSYWLALRSGSIGVLALVGQYGTGQAQIVVVFSASLLLVIRSTQTLAREDDSSKSR